MPDNVIKDNSPFPSGSEMDLDMWRAGRPEPDGARGIAGVANARIAKVYAPDGDIGERDLLARRIEMVGDLYEGLRRAAEKMSEAGLNVADEHAILAEFITPKPFPEGR